MDHGSKRKMLWLSVFLLLCLTASAYSVYQKSLSYEMPSSKAISEEIRVQVALAEFYQAIMTADLEKLDMIMSDSYVDQCKSNNYTKPVLKNLIARPNLAAKKSDGRQLLVNSSNAEHSLLLAQQKEHIHDFELRMTSLEFEDNKSAIIKCSFFDSELDHDVTLFFKKHENNDPWRLGSSKNLTDYFLRKGERNQELK